MSYVVSHRTQLALLLLALCCTPLAVAAAAAPRAAQAVSPHHDAHVFGVHVGMDVPTALRAVWENARASEPGKEKPDAKKSEGKDIRVAYKLKQGNLQLLFAEGKWVREIRMEYAEPLRYEDLRLPHSSFVGDNMRGDRVDDRYTVGFTDERQKERYWWRDEKTADGYRVRVGFVSGKLTTAGNLNQSKIFYKLITVVPEDKDKFEKAVAKS